MNINTIIDNIKYSIASDSNGKIVLAESSFLLDLLNDNKTSRKEFKPHFDWRDFRGHPFPITRYLFRLILFFVEILIWLGYWVLRLLYLPIVGRKGDKDLSTSPRVNFVLFVAVIVSYIMLIVTILVFFFKSVLLFSPSGGINNQGAIVIPQDCGKEHYIYLFNSATCWANTGIKVLEGDEIELSASGSFFGKISLMDSCAANNSKPQFPRTIISYYNGNYKNGEEEDTSTSQLLMYKKGAFGSLLMLIKEDHEDFLYDCDQNDEKGEQIMQIDFTGHNVPPRISIKKSGVLYFAVNDIYLSDEIIKKIQGSKDIQKNLSVDSIYCYENDNGQKVKTDSLKESQFSKIDRFMWFKDNVGEILLNITVIRDIMPANAYESVSLVKTYRWLEEKSMNESCHFFMFFLLGIILWLAFDRVISIICNKHTNNP